MLQPPKVSVCVVTYNQKAYISDCLKSLTEQTADFPYEIIVADDGSTDGTREIVETYAKGYPDVIRTIFQGSNIGPFRNYRSAHLSARGQYIAHLDGDDLALPGKLRAQAAVLDNSPECPAVFHRLRILDSQGKYLGRDLPPSAPERIDMRSLIRRHPLVGHSSMMYRRGFLGETLHSGEDFIDFRLYVELCAQGPLAFINEDFGCYRANVGIASSGKWIPHILAALDQARRKGAEECDVRYAAARQQLRAALKALRGGDKAEFVALILRSYANGSTSLSHELIYRARNFPGVVRWALNLYRFARYQD